MPEDGETTDAAAPRLDVITIGRSSVDLYGKQIGSRLEDVASFAKSVGGCPTNIAIGAARLGLKVGRHHRRRRRADRPLHPRAARARGRRARRRARSTAKRLTALVLLSVENDRDLPAASSTARTAPTWRSREADIDEAFIASARRVARHRHAFLQAEHRRGAAEGDADRARRPGARSSSTSTTGRTSGASPGTPRARSATSGPTGSREHLQTRAARLRPDRRHRGGDAHRRAASEDALAALRRIRALSAADASC